MRQKRANDCKVSYLGATNVEYFPIVTLFFYDLILITISIMKTIEQTTDSYVSTFNERLMNVFHVLNKNPDHLKF